MYRAERRLFSTSASATTRVEVEGDKDKDTGTGTGTGAGTMATDEDYMSFLDKANQDPNEGVARAQGSGKVEFKTTDEGVKVPGVIEKVLGKGDAFYVSDADEPFVGVALKLSGKGLPDEGMFGYVFPCFCSLWLVGSWSKTWIGLGLFGLNIC